MTKTYPLKIETEIRIEYSTAKFELIPDVAEKLGNDEVVNYLVMYDEGKIWVHENAPDWYALLATLHESICCGKQHEKFIEFSDDPDMRCAEVEAFVLTQAKDKKQEYIWARIAMFDALIQKQLAAPSDIRKLQNARDYLASQL